MFFALAWRMMRTSIIPLRIIFVALGIFTGIHFELPSAECVDELRTGVISSWLVLLGTQQVHKSSLEPNR
jgi:hypothetical protein